MLIEVIGCVDKGAETCTGVYVTNRKVSVFLEGNDLVEEIIPPTAWSTNSWPATEEEWTLKLGNTHPSFIPVVSKTVILKLDTGFYSTIESPPEKIIAHRDEVDANVRGLLKRRAEIEEQIKEKEECEEARSRSTASAYRGQAPKQAERAFKDSTRSTGGTTTSSKRRIVEPSETLSTAKVEVNSIWSSICTTSSL